MPQAKAALRSSLRGNLLQNPGQSLDKTLFDVREKYLDNLVVLITTGSIFLAAVMQWLLKVPPLIMVYTAAFYFAAALIFCVPKMLKKIPELKRLRQARDGERAVAECLDLLKKEGHNVFHDVVGADFNIDHVVVGPKGVFTVGTKTLNKRVSHNTKLYFDGESVRVGDAELPDNPVVQARAQAEWFRKTLFDSTSKIFAVKPVVVFPGWFVERTAKTGSDAWVLEPKALQAFLRNEPDRMAPEDVSLVSFHLKRYIRASN